MQSPSNGRGQRLHGDGRELQPRQNYMGIEDERSAEENHNER